MEMELGLRTSLTTSSTPGVKRKATEEPSGHAEKKMA